MSITVTLGMTSWNQGMSVLPWTLGALKSEANLLMRSGCLPKIVVVDNHSTDGTADYLSTQRRIVVTQTPEPCGVSCLRNHLVEAAFGYRSSYVALLDGDIGVIPHSLMAMIRYLEDHPALSALAMDPLVQAKEWIHASSYCLSVGKVRTDALMYLCGYGVFRLSVFDQVHFEEGGPFATPGWGSEDDDLYLQMVEAGLEVAYVEGYRFYHGTPRSSWTSLRALGIDPLSSFEARREYVFQKWREKRPQHVHSGHLNLLKGQHLRD